MDKVTGNMRSGNKIAMNTRQIDWDTRHGNKEWNDMRIYQNLNFSMFTSYDRWAVYNERSKQQYLTIYKYNRYKLQ